MNDEDWGLKGNITKEIYDFAQEGLKDCKEFQLKSIFENNQMLLPFYCGMIRVYKAIMDFIEED